MTGAGRAGRAVLWLTAQAVVFGVMAALLGIVANTMFLDTYGSEWLPVTYIAIGIAGVLISGAVARSARSAELVPIALAVLGGATAILALAWWISSSGDGAWVSVPLLVLFPILIQLGFVFIGGQAGRLLDIAGIKASFPRIVAGFPAGAVLGGIVGGWLVGWSGRIEDLLLATTIAQGVFAALVWATGRRYSALLGPTGSGPVPAASAGPDAQHDARPSLRQLLTRRFVVLIFAYQVLSALASQLADFLVFDRASAQYADGADLASFLAGYTALMNVVSIAFLFLIAGPLLRRFGLRLGITANPLVLTVFAAAMLVVDAALGAGSVTLLFVVSAARIADIALTDGTTRTSINATYQVLPERIRLAVQAAIEGIGVPVAIGVSGVLILVLDALPAAPESTIVATTITCLVWTWSAVLLYRAYGPALVDALRRRRWLDLDAAMETPDVDVLGTLRPLTSTDPRAARLAFDLLGRVATPTLAEDLATLAEDPRADVRMPALAGLSTMGDAGARRRLAEDVRATIDAPDPEVRLVAARALESIDAVDRAAAARLLVDDDLAVRCAAIESVRPDDRFAVEAVVVALGDVGTIGAASGAVERLGDAAVPALVEALDTARTPASSTVMRLVRAAATRTPARDDVLRRHVGHPDRELGLAIIERLVADEPASDGVAAALDMVLADDARQAARIVAAGLAIGHSDDWRDPGAAAGDAPLLGALADEWDLVRRRVASGRLAHHGWARFGPTLAGLSTDGPAGALAIEAVGVTLGHVERDLVLAVLQPGLSLRERLLRLGGSGGSPASAPTTGAEPTDDSAWLRDMVEDPGGRWRAPWLRACAVHAAAVRGILDGMDVGAARTLGDPVIDEELDLAGAGRAELGS